MIGLSMNIVVALRLDFIKNIQHPNAGSDPAGTQTQDLRNRNPALYSTKLPGH